MALKPLSPNTLHVVIDMQRIFAEETAWHTAAIATILPNVTTLCEAFRGDTLFVKFMLPRSPEEATGTWQGYYRHWQAMTLDVIDPAMQDVIEPLQRFATAADQIEKRTYSAFGSAVSSPVSPTLKRTNRDTEIFSPSLAILVLIRSETVVVFSLMNGCS